MKENLVEHSEEDLARAACAGDRDAFGQLFRNLYPRCHRAARALVGDDHLAHDVAQEAWIKAWEQRARFNFQSRFGTWVHRITVNTALDHLRRRKSRLRRLARLFPGGRSERPEAEPAGAGEQPDRQAVTRESARRLEAAIDRLPAKQRTVLVLREHEGYSYEEIARLVGCPKGTVMSRLHQARQKLRDSLGEELS